MTAVTIAPEVAARLGTELTDRIRQDPTVIATACRDCLQPLGSEPLAVIVIEAADPSAAVTVTLAHARCSDSQVRVQATGEDDGLDVTVITSYTLTGADPWPTLWVSYDLTALLTEAGEAQDLAVAHLLDIGWHLVTFPGPTPAALPDGWVARYTLLDVSDVWGSPGAFELLGPDGRSYGEIPQLQQGHGWVPAVIRAGGRCGIYAGALNLAHPDRARSLQHVAQRAAQDGRLVGGTIRVEVCLPDGSPITP